MRALGLSGPPPAESPAPPGPPRGAGPRRPAASRLPPPPARTTDEWSTCAHVPTRSGSCYTAFVMTCTPTASSTGPQARAQGTDNAGSAPRAGAVRARKEREDANLWGDWYTTATTNPRHLPHRPHPTTRPRGNPGPPPEPWDPPTTTQPPKPQAPPCKRGTRHGATTPGKGRADPGNRDRQMGEVGANRTRPHLTNDNDLPPTTAEHRHNHNHTITPPTTV